MRLTCTQPECQTRCTFHILCVHTHTLNGKYGRPSVVRCDVISIGVVMSWVPAVGGKMLHDIRDPFFFLSFKHPLQIISILL